MEGTMEDNMEGTMEDNMEGSMEDTMEQQEGGGKGLMSLFSKKKEVPKPPPNIFSQLEAPMQPPKKTPDNKKPSVIQKKKEDREKQLKYAKDMINAPITLMKTKANNLATTAKATPSALKNLTGNLTKKVKTGLKKLKTPYSEEQLDDLTKDLSQDDYNKNIRIFSSKFNEYLEKFLNSADSDELILQRKRIMQLLSQIRAKDVQTSAASMFTNLAGLNKNILAQSSDYEKEQVSFSEFNRTYNINNIDIVKLVTDGIYNNYVANVFSDNNKEKAKKFFLELLIIYYYPTIILYIIHENMKTYINVIKTTRDKIINTQDSSITTMIDSLLSDAGDDDSRVRVDDMDDDDSRRRARAAKVAMAAQAGDGTDDEEEEEEDEEDEEDEEKDDDKGLAIGGVAFMQGGAFELALIKNYNNDATHNPYLNSSGTMFYNALINFAVSMSINDKSKIKDKMLNCLKDILIEQFNIITDNNFSNQKELNDAESKFQQIKEALESNVNGTEYIKAYNESKEYKKQLEDLIKTENDPTINIKNYRNEKDKLEGELSKSDGFIKHAEKNTIIQDTIADYKDAERQYEYFKDYFAKSEDTRKKINTLLIYMFASDLEDEETATRSASPLSASVRVSAPASPAASPPASSLAAIFKKFGRSSRVGPAPPEPDALPAPMIAPPAPMIAPPAPMIAPPAIAPLALAPAPAVDAPAVDAPPAIAPPALAPPALAPPALAPAPEPDAVAAPAPEPDAVAAPPLAAPMIAPPLAAPDSPPPPEQANAPPGTRETVQEIRLRKLRERVDAAQAITSDSRRRLNELTKTGGSTDDDIYCYGLMYNTPYTLVIENSIVKGIGRSSMFIFLQQPAPVSTQVDTRLTLDQRVGGKRATRRYKKRAGTRRQKKRRGTHRKRKNTTR